jgi:hypothetical protein
VAFLALAGTALGLTLALGGGLAMAAPMWRRD